MDLARLNRIDLRRQRVRNSAEDFAGQHPQRPETMFWETWRDTRDSRRF